MERARPATGRVRHAVKQQAPLRLPALWTLHCARRRCLTAGDRDALPAVGNRSDGSRLRSEVCRQTSLCATCGDKVQFARRQTLGSRCLSQGLHRVLPLADPCGSRGQDSHEVASLFRLAGASALLDPATCKVLSPMRTRIAASIGSSTLGLRPARIQRHEILGWPDARADPTSGTQRVVWYLVSTTPSGNVRVSTKLRFTQLSRAVKNGVPPPTRTG
jgi:hypothetical protein